jgi:hypothetical protein
MISENQILYLEHSNGIKFKQMTKEENILLSEYKSICENAYMPSSASNVLAGRCTGKAIEYAKQQAIAFDVWKRENCITYDYENNAYSKLIFLDVDHTKVRTEQLSIDDTYNQFIEQQTENK